MQLILLLTHKSTPFHLMKRFIIVASRISNHLARVRKLTGKPVAFTTSDCEFETRRIHRIYETYLPFLAVASSAWRTHSDLLPGNLAIAACSSRFSSDDNRALTIMPLSLVLATGGRPILAFIKYFA